MTIREDVRGFVLSTFYAPVGLSDETSLFDERLIDAAGLGELIAFIEENYAVCVADSDRRPESFSSIAIICAYIERRLREIETTPESGLRTLPILEDENSAVPGGPKRATA